MSGSPGSYSLPAFIEPHSFHTIGEISIALTKPIETQTRFGGHGEVGRFGKRSLRSFLRTINYLAESALLLLLTRYKNQNASNGCHHITLVEPSGVRNQRGSNTMR